VQNNFYASLAVFLSLTDLLTVSARADNIEDFYRGKTINFIIGYPTGGANDAFVRLAAQHIGKHIPGKPNVLTRHMPGGGSLIAANHLFNVAPKDGTVLSLLAATIPLEQLLGVPNTNFRAAQFNWIGRMAPGTNVTFVMSNSSVKSLSDAFDRPAVLSATGQSATSAIYPDVLNKVVGTKFKLVIGYKGTADAMLAMEQGEVAGHTTSWDGLRSLHGDWVTTGKVNLLVQYGLTRHPDLPDVPTSVELGRNSEERQVLRVVASAVEIGKMILTTPGVPAERIQALRHAFTAMTLDPEYISNMKKQSLELNPLSGEALQQLVEELEATPETTVSKVKAVYPTH